MSKFSIPNIRLAGVAACVPKNQVSNKDFDLISEKERELLIKTTGIEKRRIAPKGVCTSDLCITAANKLMEELGWAKEEIDVLIFVTQTPDYITPATSNIIQDKMGLPVGCLALDINLGCSGYVYGMSVVASLLNNLSKGKGLLLVGDISSACISGKDKSTTPIFSDAGSASAFEKLDGAAPIYFNLEGNGKGYDAIIIPEGGYRNPFSQSSLDYHELTHGISRNGTHLILKGIDIYNFSVNEVPPNVNKLLEFADIDKDEIDYFVFHQANKLINESIKRKLMLSDQQVPYSLGQLGNTSSATIPVTIVTEIREDVMQGPLKLVFSGFGVGLSWSAAYLQTDGIVCPALIEV